MHAEKLWCMHTSRLTSVSSVLLCLLPTDKAQPLYERALAIYEKVYGPDHPEVAHTLTDLAVLHLEAVSRINSDVHICMQAANPVPFVKQC